MKVDGFRGGVKDGEEVVIAPLYCAYIIISIIAANIHFSMNDLSLKLPPDH